MRVEDREINRFRLCQYLTDTTGLAVVFELFIDINMTGRQVVFELFIDIAATVVAQTRLLW